MGEGSAPLAAEDGPPAGRRRPEGDRAGPRLCTEAGCPALPAFGVLHFAVTDPCVRSFFWPFQVPDPDVLRMTPARFRRGDIDRFDRAALVLVGHSNALACLLHVASLSWACGRADSTARASFPASGSGVKKRTRSSCRTASLG